MGFVHGKNTVVKVGDLSGSLQDISAYVNSAKWGYKTDRPATQAFGKLAQKKEATGLREATLSLQGFYQHVAGTKLHGKAARVIQDIYALSGYLQKGSIKRDIDCPDTQCFGDAWKRRSSAAKGLMKATISLNGLFDNSAGAVDAVLRASVAVDPPGQNLISLGLNGFAAGNLVEMMQAVLPTYDNSSAEEQLVQVSGQFDSDELIDCGVSLHDLVAETGAPPVNGTDVDWTDVSTTSGWVAHLHVTAFSGTSVVIKIQDSADGSSWADLASAAFTSVTAPVSQRLESFGSTVRRHTRVIIASGTYTSCTFVCTFSRRAFITATAGTHKHFCGLLTYGVPTIGAGSVGANIPFEYAPQGTTTGSRKFTGGTQNSYAGGLILKSHSADFDENGLSKFSAELITDGAVQETAY